jgi:hypothetical protein
MNKYFGDFDNDHRRRHVHDQLLESLPKITALQVLSGCLELDDESTNVNTVALFFSQQAAVLDVLLLWID